MERPDQDKIRKAFKVRRTMQTIAVALALFVVLLMAAVYKRPDLFGGISKDTLVAVQILLIVSFISFTAFNWRCPACNKYLGGDIGRRTCRHCNTRLQ